jgi:hypothetical protein
MALKKSSGGSNDSRPNGKAPKKNPGPAQPIKTNFTNGRTPDNNAKREAWKAKGGRADSETTPHWKTGLVYKKEKQGTPDVLVNA